MNKADALNGWNLHQKQIFNHKINLMFIHPKLIVWSARSATAAREKFDFC